MSLRNDDQLTLDLEREIPHGVRCARALRRQAGLPASLTAPDALAQLYAILRNSGRPQRRPHEEDAAG